MAKNPEYFKGTGKEVEYAAGNLTKICIHSGYYTFEDATIVTEDLCKQMTSYITMRKELVLGAHANISQMVEVGQQVKTGDALIVFEDVMGDADMNAFLDSLRGGEEINKDAKNYLKSKYTGVIEDIKVYYTVPEEELSPSLRAMVRKYNANLNAKRDLLAKYYNDEEDNNIILPPSEMINTPNGKVKGVTVGEGVLIEFYIKYADELGIGKFIAA